MKKDKYYKDLEEKGYYDSIDKRTKDYKEYKEWKAKFNEEQTVGLGDVVEKITEATGIKKVVEAVAEKLDADCGCDDRKEKFNKLKLWRRHNINCISEEDYNWYVGGEIGKRTRFNFEEQKRIVSIYNSVFNTKQKVTKCSPCFKRFIDNLNRYIEIYNS